MMGEWKFIKRLIGFASNQLLNNLMCIAGLIIYLINRSKHRLIIVCIHIVHKVCFIPILMYFIIHIPIYVYVHMLLFNN